MRRSSSGTCSWRRVCSELVTNGVEALAALAHSDYAAVLMDCHMPVMDGYQATQEIRRREGEGKRTPIIAMTASAMTQDRERALASAMDDYVSKPIVVQTLSQVLDRWIEPHPSSPAPSDVPADRVVTADATEPILDQQRLSSLQQLADLQGVDLIATLADLFTRDSTATLRAMRTAADRGDEVALEEAAHKMKGAAASIGAARVAALCQQLEVRAAGAADLGRLADVGAMDDLDGELDRALTALQSWRCAADTPELSPAVFRV